MKTEISQAIEYYKTHAYSMQEVAKMFNIDRKTLSRNLKNLGIDTSIISKEKFILISQQIHNGKYNYSLVHNFNNVKEKVKIICPIHGEFEQDVYSHKKGCGCPKCAREYVAQIKIKDKQDFLNKVFQIHGNTYDYSKTIIKNNISKVIITCKIHGDFKQSPDKHKQGRGCPICAEEQKGWTKQAWKDMLKEGDIPKFYILRCYNSKEEFIKIGRTKNSILKRYNSKKTMPYKMEVLKIIEDLNSDNIFDLEIKYKQKYKDFKYKPSIYFAGITECYDISIKDEIIYVDLTHQH